VPDLRQVAAGKIDDEVGVHGPIKARSESVRNHPMGWAQYRSGPLLMVVDNLALSQTRKKRVLWFMPAAFLFATLPPKLGIGTSVVQRVTR